MRVAVVERPLDASALLAEVASHAHGATLAFVGTVRDMNDGQAVNALDYKAYTPMAEKEMASICLEAEARWTPARVVCEHRVGSLALGDASVVIAVSHPHRAQAFEACRYVIEELKQRVPIWKREHYASGVQDWVENAQGAQLPAPGSR